MVKLYCEMKQRLCAQVAISCLYGYQFILYYRVSQTKILILKQSNKHMLIIYTKLESIQQAFNAENIILFFCRKGSITNPIGIIGFIIESFLQIKESYHNYIFLSTLYYCCTISYHSPLLFFNLFIIFFKNPLQITCTLSFLLLVTNIKMYE